jgi:Tol biopolymer transport system component
MQPSIAAADVSTVGSSTAAGVILGSAGYMSPEQVRGEEAGAQADIFAFGAIFYEMLSGQRAFPGKSWYDAMNAAAQSDPPPLPASIPAPLHCLVAGCVEKAPEDRFQSAHDLVLALESAGHERIRDRAVRRPLTIVLAVIGCSVLLWLAWQFLRPRPSIPDTQLTLRHGTVAFARYTADGDTVVYSAAWDAGPFQVYATRPDTRESWQVNIAGSANPLTLAVSRRGELAVLLPRDGISLYGLHGTLARVSLAGGDPKDVADNVVSADWTPDGTDFALSRSEYGGFTLEYPAGKVLYRTAGFIDGIRISPSGELVAFLDHDVQTDLGGRLAVIDRKGRRRDLSQRFNSARGLAWRSDGREIWFSAAAEGSSMTLYAASLTGSVRKIADLRGYATLEDIAPDGSALVATHTLSNSMLLLAPGQEKPIDLYWHDASRVQDLSSDGSVLLFAESGAATGKDFEAFIRRSDASPAKRLGFGLPMALSSDGRWAIANPSGKPAQLVRLPTGAGAEVPLTHDSIHHVAAHWLPGGHGFVFVGSETGRPFRYWQQSTDGSPPRAISPEAVAFDRSDPIPVSPDGSHLAALDPQGSLGLLTVADGSMQPVAGAKPGDVPLAWCSDNSLIVHEPPSVPADLYRIDLANHHRTPFRSLLPPNTVGLVSISPIRVSSDCRSTAYSTLNVLTTLWSFHFQ